MMLILLAVAAAQPPAQAPKAWLEHVYAGYRSESFNPFDHPDRYFSPRLAAAIAEDARLAKGEVGYLDGDPICQCQDPDGLQAFLKGMGRGGAPMRTLQPCMRPSSRTASRVYMLFTWWRSPATRNRRG